MSENTTPTNPGKEVEGSSSKSHDDIVIYTETLANMQIGSQKVNKDKCIPLAKPNFLVEMEAALNQLNVLLEEYEEPREPLLITEDEFFSANPGFERFRFGEAYDKERREREYNRLFLAFG